MVLVGVASDSKAPMAFLPDGAEVVQPARTAQSKISVGVTLPRRLDYPWTSTKHTPL